MELLIGGCLSAFTLYAATKWNKSDKDKIKYTFRNLNYKTKDYEPRHFKTHRTNDYILYSYHVPYGLVDDDKLQVLEKVLNKPVKITFAKTKLHIKVYKHSLPINIAYNWIQSDGWTLPIGQSLDGPVMHDFDKIPHMTIAGMTRHGKTVLLKLILSHLIYCNPDDVEFYIIDLKGGLEFSQHNYKQVKKVASSPLQAYDLLKDLAVDIELDMAHFKQKGYNNVLNTNIKRRKFIIVDEGAELVPHKYMDKEERKKLDYCQYALSNIARVSGALGYRLVFATQYPTADTLPRQIKQNADCKISFRVPTEVASRVAIDDQGAQDINIKGRAIYRTSDKQLIQVPYISDDEIKGRFKEYVSSTTKTAERRTDTVEFG
ncbi:FtsK/SpoIIIE domain-containing protein [Oceanobacillus kimchii]|uniref:FtsK/SpoIIIE domain-containing protein n=1 Tax=Oceanobacillus kimchii TaxID=746691 RepID=UPI00295EE454|nr:FtsK/SpoIIIE domain-containing protein [Oceanobacillus kimchii]